MQAFFLRSDPAERISSGFEDVVTSVVLYYLTVRINRNCKFLRPAP